jgi:uncharacterized protein Yka (UPF0111/DUF47 family)
MSRGMSDQERAELIASAVSHLRKAFNALKAADVPLVAEKVRRVSKHASEAYTLATGRKRHEVRCQHGTLLTRPCQACTAAAS